MMLLIAFLLAAETPAKTTVAPPAPDSVLQVRSYGEAAKNLQDLLEPLLDEYSFREFKQLSTPSVKYVAAECVNFNEDHVYIFGAPNCLEVGYFATRHPPNPSLPPPLQRAARFMLELRQFLDTLPSPRPRALETQWSWNSWCGH